MKGFKDFIMRGNLVELAVAFIMGTAFAAVVTAFTKIIIELLAKAGGAPDFDSWKPGGLTSIGPFLTALVGFIIMAAVLYFFVVKPYEIAKKRFTEAPAEEGPAPDAQMVELLQEIRDQLKTRG